MSEQQILKRMDAHRGRAAKVATLYSSKSSNVNKLANIKRENTAEHYNKESLDKTFARTLMRTVEYSKAAASRIVR